MYRDLEIGDRNISILTPEHVLRLLALKPELTVDFFFDETFTLILNGSDKPIVIDDILTGRDRGGLG